METRRIIFYNQKGGVGKTTSTLNLGSCLADMGKKVLLIDFDAQLNLTHAVNADDTKKNIYQAVVGKCDIKETVQSTIYNNLYIIPGSLDLAGLSIELVNEENREKYLTNTISSLDGLYDFILVDCPPSLGLETINALCWCDEVIIPLQCEYMAMEGLNLIMRTVSNAKKTFNKEIKILGILFTMFSKRSLLSLEVVDDITSVFPSLVFNTKIPRNIRIAEAPSFGQPIEYYDPGCSGAKAFKEFALEVINRG